MAAYSIGEAEELTGVKAHVLRYWETVIPGFAPQKDLGGRRIYSQREIDIILRLKYLIEIKRFTIEGARKQVIEESDSITSHAELLQAIHDLRADLTELYLCIRKYRPVKNNDTGTKLQEAT